ncbi:hypothetical protein [Kineococcus sp. SYSU DK004]|uniref:hypothetical protein n=1 Tax=Kineococcus sp. SYSU DK004 TaxID=3383125 RepID=UPI003D7C7AF4
MAAGPPAAGGAGARAAPPGGPGSPLVLGLLLRWARAPVLVRVLLVYAVARLFSAAVLAAVARFQEPSGWTPEGAGYRDMLGLWDATWYRRIAEDGYPGAVPRDGDGAPQQSELAFYPVFPLLVRALGAAGLPFETAGAALALLAGAAAAVGAHLVLERAALAAGAGAATARRAAWSGAVLLCVSPPSLVYQVPYTEGLALALLTGFLLALLDGRWLTASGLALLLGLTRPVAVPLSAVVVVHLLVRVRAARRTACGAPVRPAARDVLRAGVLLASSAAAAGLWPLAAWSLTGERDAYTATMGAWRADGRVEWLRPWWDVSQYLLGDVAGPLALVALLAGYAALVLSRRAAVLGPELRTWCLAYAGYLLLVLDPFTSLFRYLVLLFPLGGLAALRPGRRGTLWALVAASLALHVVWVAWLWRFSPPADWPP